METTQKPKKVSLAVNLLLISVILGVVNSVISQIIGVPSVTSVVEAVFIQAMAIVLFGLLIFMISKGKKWAFMTYMILLALGLIGFLFTAAAIFAASVIEGSLSVIQAILQILAAIALCSSESRGWFNLKIWQSIEAGQPDQTQTPSQA